MRAIGAGLLVLVLGVAGCSSDGAGGASSTLASSVPTAGSTIVSTSVSVPPVSTSPPTTPSSSSTAPTSAAPSTALPSTTTSTTTPTTTSTTTPPGTTCTQVTVLLLPGGAVPNTEIAGLIYTNSGKVACTLVGYPDVQLLRAGSAIGRPAQPSSASSAIRLAPGGQAESKISDNVRDCTAPVSDHARVTVPGRPRPYVREIALRACRLRVGPLGPPD